MALAKARIGVGIVDVGSRVLERLQDLHTEPGIVGLEQRREFCRIPN